MPFKNKKIERLLEIENYGFSELLYKLGKQGGTGLNYHMVILMENGLLKKPRSVYQR